MKVESIRKYRRENELRGTVADAYRDYCIWMKARGETPAAYSTFYQHAGGIK